MYSFLCGAAPAHVDVFGALRRAWSARTQTTHAHASTHTQACTHMHARTHAHMHARTHTHTRMHTQDTHPPTNPHEDTNHAHTTRTQTTHTQHAHNTHTRTHAHTHTHTHTHTQDTRARANTSPHAQTRTQFTRARTCDNPPNHRGSVDSPRAIYKGTKFFPMWPGGSSVSWHQDCHYFGTASAQIISYDPALVRARVHARSAHTRRMRALLGSIDSSGWWLLTLLCCLAAGVESTSRYCSHRGSSLRTAVRAGGCVTAQHAALQLHRTIRSTQHPTSHQGGQCGNLRSRRPTAVTAASKLCRARTYAAWSHTPPAPARWRRSCRGAHGCIAAAAEAAATLANASAPRRDCAGGDAARACARGGHAGRMGDGR
jgi:hypothetical protein